MRALRSRQSLVEADPATANSHGALLRVCSGDGQVDFKGGGGGAVSDTRVPIASIAKMFTAPLPRLA